MSDLRAAAQQALEALEGRAVNRYFEHLGETIAALRAALEQPEQEPVAWRLPDPDPEGRFEWVLYQTADFMPGVNPMDHFDGLEPLYTHPPRREWRSLSEEEIKNAVGASAEFWATSALWIKSVARAIEAALRSKNHE